MEDLEAYASRARGGTSMAEPVPQSVQRPFDPTVLPAERPLAPQGSVTSHGTLAVYEPGSGKLVGEVRVASAAQVREATAAARSAQKGWSQIGRASCRERGE